MQNKKTIIIFQEINWKIMKKIFNYKKLDFRNDYILITEPNWRIQWIKDFKNFIADIDNFEDLEKFYNKQ